jgi:hypothetical protein
MGFYKAEIKDTEEEEELNLPEDHEAVVVVFRKMQFEAVQL